MRNRLRKRLADEFGDEALASVIVEGLSDELVVQLHELAKDDLSASPLLSYTLPTVSPLEIESIWVFAYGYRFKPDAVGTQSNEAAAVPPMDSLLPGPTNEALAQAVAAFVADYPVPIFAQWEVARVLDGLGVDSVTSIEPDVAADGTITYLSTEGVARKGMRLAEEAGLAIGYAGVIGFADHVVRCVMTARAVGLHAGVPGGVVLPSRYDPESGQPWTRSRQAYIPPDLLGRAWLASEHPIVVAG